MKTGGTCPLIALMKQNNIVFSLRSVETTERICLTSVGATTFGDFKTAGTPDIPYALSCKLIYQVDYQKTLKYLLC